MLNLAPLFQSYAEENKVFLHGFQSSGNLGRGHWNEDGHRLAGELIARWLCREYRRSPVAGGRQPGSGMVPDARRVPITLSSDGLGEKR